MQHKAPWLFIYVVLFCLVSQSGIAQNLTKSPYSIIGVGEQHYYGSSYQSAMGQVAQGMRRPADINVMNPASFSSLKFTVIDAGAYYAKGTLANNSASSEVRNYSFSYFMFGIPLSTKRNAGMVFGLSPYSTIGYKVSNTNDYGTYTGTTQMTGGGGLSRFHFGAGAQIVKDVSFGFNANYLFGQTRLDQRLIIPPNYYMFNVAEIRTRNIGDFQFQFGLQYHHDFKKGKKEDVYTFVAGASYTVASKLKAYEDHLVGSMAVGQTSYIRDTIEFVTSNKGTVDLPFIFSGGLSLEKKDNWTIAADVNYTDWSSYRSFGYSDSLKNTLGMSIGACFTPNASNYKNYLKRIEYRAGARYDNGSLNLRNTNISTYGISAGVGLPLGKSKTKLNITAEYYVKGTKQNNLIREEYFRIVFGANFSDRWFQRYKYD
jgi:long-subunit fatty acid transport protein